MNVNIRFHGIVEQILDEAVKQGYASTKTEALRLGAFELNNRYGLLDTLEDEADIAKADSIMEKITSAKSKLHSHKEIITKLK